MVVKNSEAGGEGEKNVRVHSYANAMAFIRNEGGLAGEDREDRHE